MTYEDNQYGTQKAHGKVYGYKNFQGTDGGQIQDAYRYQGKVRGRQTGSEEGTRKVPSERLTRLSAEASSTVRGTVGENPR